jgi:5-methyltetrahydropteroyltriglutamate--homocysteine methyltransferase
MVHYRGGRAAIDESVYPDLEGFWEDLAAAYADEIGPSGTSAAPTSSSTTRASPT